MAARKRTRHSLGRATQSSSSAANEVRVAWLTADQMFTNSQRLLGHCRALL
jgi:hypothetical protein